MSSKNIQISEKQDLFRGALAGLMIGDAWGAPVEMSNRASIDVRQIVECKKKFQYTDDTQEAIALAESIIQFRTVVAQDIFSKFHSNYHEMPIKGYSTRFTALLETSESGVDLMQRIKPESDNDGAAMRIAPMGLAYAHDLELLKQRSMDASRITHNLPDGIAGAVAVSYIIARNIRDDYVDINALLDDIASFVADISPNFAFKIAAVRDNLDADLPKLLELIGCENPVFGAGTKAVEAVPAAIYHFARNPDNYELAVFNAICTGGDTDTIAAIAGAMAGSHVGYTRIPDLFKENILASQKGLDYIVGLADKIHSIYLIEGFR